MAKSHRQYVCSACGGAQLRWAGKCPDCGEWNSLAERVIEDVAPDLHRPPVGDADAASGTASAAPRPLHEIPLDESVRWTSGIGEFDRVLGGGLVAGSAVLLGGDPGIGKSTLALQVAHALAARGRRTIYVTSEESAGQVRLRAERLQPQMDAPSPRITQARGRAAAPAAQSGDAAGSNGAVLVAAQSNLDIILNQLRLNRPDVLIVDSIQMVYRPDLPSVPGSATQLRDCAARLVWTAKQMGIALILVGHVTKEGAIAGPKVLEHIVDCVVYFEGERFHSHRLIRSVKNRFGSTDELGIFEMTDGGLLAVEDPSRLFLERMDAARPGSVILAACEGTRVLMVEVQALCVQSVFGAAKRKATGVDANRVAMILAVIEKHAGSVLGDQDVFVNIVGGVRVVEPAADLAIALAVVGTLTGRSLPRGAAVFGEVGLGGEVRPVQHVRRRSAEAQRLGLAHLLAPAVERTGRRVEPAVAPRRAEDAMQLHPCGTLQDAIRLLA